MCLSNAFSIVSTEETSESSSLEVAHLCSNKLYWSWKHMSELVWMGNSPDSIFMHLVEEYVMRSCRYTTVKSHWKVVPSVYIGMHRWYIGVCVLCGSGMLELFSRSIYISKVWICRFSYWHVCPWYLSTSALLGNSYCPGLVGLCWLRVNLGGPSALGISALFYMWKIFSVIGLCRSQFD